MSKLSSTKNVVASFIMLLLLHTFAESEVRSGIWILDRLNRDSAFSYVDFSELTPFCSKQSIAASRCSLKVADCIFRYGSVIAPSGVCSDSALSAYAQSLILRKTINYDRESLFYLDSMMKKYDLKAPKEGYGDSVSINNGRAFFVKTGEDRYAVMIQLKVLVGGAIDQIWYYWAYRTESGEALYKDKLFEQPAGLVIDPDVFSGRPNPSFQLTDPAAIAEITHAIYVSVNTLLDSTVKRPDTSTCNSGYLGYRKMSISQMFPPDNPISSYMPYIEICGGKMTYYRVPPTSVSAERVPLYDKESKLEKLIIRIGCEKNLTATDQYGAISFCDLVPDSLKPSVSLNGNRSTERKNKPKIIMRAGSGGIRFLFIPSGQAHIEFFDPAGKRKASVRRQVHENEILTIDLRKFSIGAGTYIVILNHSNLTNGYRYFPALFLSNLTSSPE